MIERTLKFGSNDWNYKEGVCVDEGLFTLIITVSSYVNLRIVSLYDLMKEGEKNEAN